MELAGSINTAAAIGGDASGDAAAGHRELNLFAVLPRINTYTAAELCGAADNIAADHGQLPAGCDIHTAATIYCDAERKRITGHDLNMRLSQQRADSVASALITQGVDASRIRTQGLGPANPIASNSTAEGKAQNRRVEITLSPL